MPNLSSTMSSFISYSKALRKPKESKAGGKGTISAASYGMTSPHPYASVASSSTSDIVNITPTTTHTQSIEDEQSQPEPEPEPETGTGTGTTTPTSSPQLTPIKPTTPPQKLDVELPSDTMEDWFPSHLLASDEHSHSQKQLEDGSDSASEYSSEHDPKVARNLQSTGHTNPQGLTIPSSRKTAPSPIKIPSPYMHGPKVQIIRSSSGAKPESSNTRSRPESSGSGLYSGEVTEESSYSAISGTTLARALIGNSYVLSLDSRDKDYGDREGKTMRYRSGTSSSGSLLTRMDSATLPREDPFGLYSGNGSGNQFLHSPSPGSGLGPWSGSASGGIEVPSLPPNADAVYIPPKNPRRKRLSTGNVESGAGAALGRSDSHQSEKRRRIEQEGNVLDVHTDTAASTASSSHPRSPSTPTTPTNPISEMDRDPEPPSSLSTDGASTSSSSDTIDDYYSSTASGSGLHESILPLPPIPGGMFRPAFSPITEESLSQIATSPFSTSTSASAFSYSFSSSSDSSSQLTPPTPYRSGTPRRDSRRNTKNGVGTGSPNGPRGPGGQNQRLPSLVENNSQRQSTASGFSVPSIISPPLPAVAVTSPPSNSSARSSPTLQFQLPPAAQASSSSLSESHSQPAPNTPSQNSMTTVKSIGATSQSQVSPPSSPTAISNALRISTSSSLAPPPVFSLFGRPRSGSAPNPIKIIRDSQDLSGTAFNLVSTANVGNGYGGRPVSMVSGEGEVIDGYGYGRNGIRNGMDLDLPTSPSEASPTLTRAGTTLTRAGSRSHRAVQRLMERDRMYNTKQTFPETPRLFSPVWSLRSSGSTGRGSVEGGSMEGISIGRKSFEAEDADTIAIVMGMERGRNGRFHRTRDSENEILIAVPPTPLTAPLPSAAVPTTALPPGTAGVGPAPGVVAGAVPRATVPGVEVTDSDSVLGSNPMGPRDPMPPFAHHMLARAASSVRHSRAPGSGSSSRNGIGGRTVAPTLPGATVSESEKDGDRNRDTEEGISIGEVAGDTDSGKGDKTKTNVNAGEHWKRYSWVTQHLSPITSTDGASIGDGVRNGERSPISIESVSSGVTSHTGQDNVSLFNSNPSLISQNAPNTNTSQTSSSGIRGLPARPSPAASVQPAMPPSPTIFGVPSLPGGVAATSSDSLPKANSNSQPQVQASLTPNLNVYPNTYPATPYSQNQTQLPVPPPPPPPLPPVPSASSSHSQVSLPMSGPASVPQGAGSTDSGAMGSPPPYHTLVFDQSQPGSGHSHGHTPNPPPSRADTPTKMSMYGNKSSGSGRNRPPLPLGPRRPSAGARQRNGSVSSVNSNGNTTMTSTTTSTSKFRTVSTSSNLPHTPYTSQTTHVPYASVHSSSYSSLPAHMPNSPSHPSYSSHPSPAPHTPRFQTPTPKWRGYPMDAAKWTFTSAQLQAIVSRAIRQSAEASAIRLLRLETVDVDIPNEMRKLEQRRTDAKTRYKIVWRRREEIMRALENVLLQGQGMGDEDPFRILSDLNETCITLDRLAEDLHSLDSEIAQLTSLKDIHGASALAMAIRKLNASFLKQIAVSEQLREQVIALEQERDLAWKQAEVVANDFDRLNERVATGSGIEHGNTLGDDNGGGELSVNTSPTASNRSSRVSAMRKSSLRASKAGLRSTKSPRNSISSIYRLSGTSSSAGGRSPFSLDDAPPVPPIPISTPISVLRERRGRARPGNIATDLPSTRSFFALSTDGPTPNTETRAMYEELCIMLGIPSGAIGSSRVPRRSYSVIEGPRSSAQVRSPRLEHEPFASVSIRSSTTPTGARPGRLRSGRPLSMPDRTALTEVYQSMSADGAAMLATLGLLSESD